MHLSRSAPHVCAQVDMLRASVGHSHTQAQAVRWPQMKRLNLSLPSLIVFLSCLAQRWRSGMTHATPVRSGTTRIRTTRCPRRPRWAAGAPPPAPSRQVWHAGHALHPAWGTLCTLSALAGSAALAGDAADERAVRRSGGPAIKVMTRSLCTPGRAKWLAPAQCPLDFLSGPACRGWPHAILTLSTKTPSSTDTMLVHKQGRRPGRPADAPLRCAAQASPSARPG